MAVALTKVQREIVETLQMGAHRRMAARAAGVSPVDLESWVRLGREPGSQYARFANAVLTAEAKAYVESLRLLAVAAQAGEPAHAVRWFLERRWPSLFDQKALDVIERERERVCDVIEGLTGELGEDVVDRVLAALAGDDSVQQAASETTIKVH